MYAVMLDSGFGALVDGKGLSDENGTDCCCGDGGLYYTLTLCHTANAPPEVPRRIAVPLPFTCWGCPLSSRRIVIYRGYCYEASPNFDGACTPLPCAGGACESPPVPRSAVGNDPIVNPGELQCKPLDATCSTVPCVPEEPGCCTELGSICGGVCNRPKRFRIVCQGETTVTEWCSESPQDCQSWAIILKYKIKWNFWHEFQCVEGQGDRSPATPRAGGGEIVVDIQTLSPYYASIGMGQYAGTWRTDTASADYGGYLGGISGYSATFTNGALALPAFTHLPIGNPACGVTVPDGPNNETTSCTGGRYSRRQSIVGNASDGSAIQGTLTETEYADCNHYMFKRNTNTTDSPFRCPGQPRWIENSQNQKQLVFVTACPGDPPQAPLPDGARAFVGIDQTDIFPLSTGSLF